MPLIQWNAIFGNHIDSGKIIGFREIDIYLMEYYFFSNNLDVEVSNELDL